MTNAELEEGQRQLSNRIADIERLIAEQGETFGELIEHMEKTKIEKAKEIAL